MQNSFKTSVKFIIYESFRPRSPDEYRAVLKNGEAFARRPVPWLYLRALAFGLVLFAVSAVINTVTSYTAAFAMAVAFGGLAFNVPLVIFFYELCPRRETGLFTLFAVAVIGGVISTGLGLLGYEYIYDGHDNPWISYLWTGFLEETAKMAAAIPAIILLKKREPFACFLIGIAVGTGYSVFEDLGYIYSYGSGFRTGDSWVVLMSLGRGLSCFCSHAPWTGVICWAFAAFKRPWINFRFYLVVLSSMLLHYLADVPFYADGVRFLEGFNAGWAIEAAVVAGIVAMTCLMLRHSMRELGCENRSDDEKTAPPLTKRARLAHAGNLTAVICAVTAGLLACGACAVQPSGKTVTNYFESESDFIAAMQSGESLYADWNRGYDKECENYSQFSEDGRLKAATQRVEADERDYFYVYAFGENDVYLTSVGVKIEGEVRYCRRMFIYGDGSVIVNHGYPNNYRPVEDDPPPAEEPADPVDPPEPADPPELLKVVCYFQIAEASGSYDSEGGKFVVRKSVPDGMSDIAVIALSVLAAVVTAGGAVAFIVLKNKSVRLKDD